MLVLRGPLLSSQEERENFGTRFKAQAKIRGPGFKLVWSTITTIYKKKGETKKRWMVINLWSTSICYHDKLYNQRSRDHKTSTSV